MVMQNSAYISSEYKKRSLTSLLVEYARLSTYIDVILSDNHNCIDEDTELRYSLVQEEICSKLLADSHFCDGKYVDFCYFD